VPDWLATIIQTFLRFVPFPATPGLQRLGRPGRDAPVLVTCNFDLTVRRVRRALRGLDCYLLVCHSKGINVWCAASAGHFSAHSVISELKRSEIDQLVDHRELILPQFSAPGIDTERIARETGWTCKFGPAYARDIPVYLAVGEATPQMRLARFPLRDRLEMASMWGFPFSLVLVAILLLTGQAAHIPAMMALVWAISLTMFVGFHLLERISWLPTGLHKALLVGAVAMLVVLLWGGLAGNWPMGRFIRWSVASLGIALMTGIDFEGMSPHLPAALLAYWGRRFPSFLRGLARIGFDVGHSFALSLSRDRCTGCGRCLDVCPRAVYAMDVIGEQRLSRLADPDACELCAACVRQCPAGAIIADPPVRQF